MGYNNTRNLCSVVVLSMGRQLDGVILPHAAPDKTDWIIACQDQEKVYPLILIAIELLVKLLE
jgi:hypothetical protein